MLKRKDFPTIFFDNNTSFEDMSITLLTYLEKTHTVDFVAADDKLYFGRRKPFNTIYVEMSTVNTNASTMTVKFFDETTSTFIAVTDLVDETFGLTQSGFIQFKNPNTSASEPWTTNAINSTTKYWIQISFSADLLSTTAIQGMNLVFSDDDDMKGIHPGVENYLRTGTSSFILHHQSARDWIINSLRRDGKLKVQLGDSGDGLIADLDVWDVHLPEQVNRWSVFLALHSLFKQLGTQPDDQFNEMAKNYLTLAGEAKDVYYLSLDLDDDGTMDIEERAVENSTGRFRRI